MSLVGMGFDSKRDFTPPTVLLSLLLCPDRGYIFFFSGIQHSPDDGFSAASCNFGVLAGEEELTSFYSVILNVRLVKSMVLPVVMYGYESWTTKKAEH